MGLTPVCGGGRDMGGVKGSICFFFFRLNLWNKHCCTEEFVNTLYCSYVFKRFNISLIHNVYGHGVKSILGQPFPHESCRDIPPASPSGLFRDLLVADLGTALKRPIDLFYNLSENRTVPLPFVSKGFDHVFCGFD